MNKKKRILSWILAALLVFSLIPVYTFAADDCNHEDYEVVSVLRDADCKEGIRGIRKLKCESCDRAWYEQYIGHEMIEDAFIDATCDTPAKIGEICAICGVEGEVVTVEGSELGHDMQLDKTNEAYVEATCDEKGLDTLKCSRCDKTETKETEAIGHDWVDGAVVEADCENAAGVEQFCANCGKTQVIPFEDELAEDAKGHTPEEVEDIIPTCTEAGHTGMVICSVCGDVLEEGTEVPADATAHKAVLKSALKEATCKTNGIGKYVCEYCGANMGYKVIPAAHNWLAIDEIKVATCGEDGEMYYFCDACGEEKIETIKATGEHNMAEDIIIPATCDSPEKAGEICTVCGTEGKTVIVEGSEALGHDMQLDAANEEYVAATCVEGGLDTLKCSRCGKTETKETEAIGHVWEDLRAVDADCINAAGVEQFCENCGETQVVPFEGDLAEDAKGHTFEEVDDIAPTCSEVGRTGMVICSVCEEIIEEGTEVPVDATAHKAVLKSALKEATCKTNGIGKYSCEYCDANMGYKVIPADHVWGDGIETKAASCGEDGEMIYVCEVCEEIKTEAIKATGEHDMVETTIDATCDSPAKVGEKCSVCGAEGETVIVDGSEALGHDMQLDTTNDDYVAATCTEGGFDTLKCSRCDKTETKETEALGHDWVDGDIVEADCVNAAGVEQFCENCGEIQVVPFEGELAEESKGHTPEAVEDIAPTCSTTGITGRVICSVCGEVIEEGTELPMDENAHVAVLNSVLKEATCTVAGIGKYVCEYCDANMGYKVFYADHEWSEDLLDEDAAVIYRICVNCDEIYIVEDLNDEHVHVYEAVVTEPTCTAVGYTTYTCECGDTYTADEVDMIAHVYEAVVTEPTCTAVGYTTYTCACGDNYVSDETAMSEHVWDNGVVTVKPTQSSDGVRTYTCGTCGAIKTQNIARLPHSHSYSAVFVGGKITYVCSCGASMH